LHTNTICQNWAFGDIIWQASKYFEILLRETTARCIMAKKTPGHPFDQGLLWGLVVQGKRLLKPLIESTSLNAVISSIFVKWYKFYLSDREPRCTRIREANSYLPSIDSAKTMLNWLFVAQFSSYRYKIRRLHILKIMIDTNTSNQNIWIMKYTP
jgi:hypothetical protein